MSKSIQVWLTKEELEDITGILLYMEGRNLLTFESQEHVEGFKYIKEKLEKALKKAGKDE